MCGELRKVMIHPLATGNVFIPVQRDLQSRYGYVCVAKYCVVIDASRDLLTSLLTCKEWLSCRFDDIEFQIRHKYVCGITFYLNTIFY